MVYILGFLTIHISSRLVVLGDRYDHVRQGEIIATQANTIAAAQSVLPAVAGERRSSVIHVQAGETVGVKGPDPTPTKE